MIRELQRHNRSGAWEFPGLKLAPETLRELTTATHPAGMYRQFFSAARPRAAASDSGIGNAMKNSVPPPPVPAGHSADAASAPGKGNAPGVKPGGPAERQGDSWRETVESIVVAFMLAFLFRTFLMEAFVIPTGSMAETLFGRHKDVNCEECGVRYRVGASDEVDRDAGFYRKDGRVHYGFCPNCRYPQKIYDDPVFKGDRILVNKFPYEFFDPHPWDVVVFKYPEDPKTNYIKRLVGLPGETITLEWGDVYYRTGDGPIQIKRKPPEKQRAMQMLVYDHDRPARVLLEQGWPERWTGTGDWHWQAEPETRSFQSDSKPRGSGDYDWIRYRHLVPTGADWDRVVEEEDNGKKIPFEPQPLLVSDFYAYNSGYEGNSPVFNPARDMLGEHWVGDLTVQCELEVQEAAGEVLFELVESLRRYRCAIDLKTGEATLYYQDEDLRDANSNEYDPVVLGKAPTSISKTGKYRIGFANVDDRLCLWVNDRLVAFPGNGEYDSAARAGYRLPTENDLSPVGIATKNARVRIAHLAIYRDLYYTNVMDDSNRDWRLLLSNPRSYGEYASHVRTDTFALGEDEFFMLGDNSPRSADSRLWENRRFRQHAYAVPRNLLLGKAFFIYWPHGVPFGNNGHGYASWFNFPPLNQFFYHKERVWNGRNEAVEISDYPGFTVPFYPQFTRMKRIR